MKVNKPRIKFPKWALSPDGCAAIFARMARESKQGESVDSNGMTSKQRQEWNDTIAAYYALYAAELLAPNARPRPPYRASAT